MNPIETDERGRKRDREIENVSERIPRERMQREQIQRETECR